MMLDSGIERRAPPKKAGVVSRVVTVAGQLVLPVLALGGAIALAWMCRGYVATDFRFLVKIDPSLDLSDGWLTWGVLLLPCVFFALNLTSRRYGPAIAFAAVALAWIFSCRRSRTRDTGGVDPLVRRNRGDPYDRRICRGDVSRSDREHLPLRLVSGHSVVEGSVRGGAVRRARFSPPCFIP